MANNATEGESAAEPTPGDAVPESDGRRRRSLAARLALWGSLSVVVLAVGAALVVYRQLRPALSSTFRVVDYDLPDAPRLAAGNGETVYRIDASHSSVSYAVDERIAGHTTGRAKGSTSGISGDIALNSANPAASRVGEIVVNIEQLHSNNNLRDARIRASYLKSHDNPLAHFTTGTLTGLPAKLVEGQTYHFTMSGQLQLALSAPVQWDVQAKVANGTLTATATTVVKMSTFGVGPINIAGLVSTGDDVTLTMKLTAVDPSKHPVPTQIAAPAGAPRTGDGGSFAKDIQPILETACASCHTKGEVGAAHWQLDTAADAEKIADGIGTVVESRYMPPWPASDLGVPLAHSKQLSAQQIAAIQKWSRAGGPLDVPATTAIKAKDAPNAGAKPRHDVVLKMPAAYTGSLTNPNDYRCFVLDPHFTEPTWVTGYEVTPGHREEIHHSQIFHISAQQALAGEARSGEGGQPGWSCYGGPGLPGRTPGVVRGFTGQPGLIAGWVPGQDPVVYPESSGVLFQPGDALVFQLHYHFDKTPVPDRSTVALQIEPGTAKLKRLDIVNPVGPVEIPCMPGATAPLCNRDAALVEAGRLYGPAGTFIEPGLLALCGKTPEQLAATFKDGVAHSTCDSKVGESGVIVGVMGHMHTLGKSIRLTLNPGTPSEKVLLDIPVWNFDWQMNYQLQTPLHVNAGDTIRMDCSWDRSLDPNRPQKYIIFAEGTEDEMCFSTYSMIADDQ